MVLKNDIIYDGDYFGTSLPFTSLHLIRRDMTLWMLHACK